MWQGCWGALLLDAALDGSGDGMQHLVHCMPRAPHTPVMLAGAARLLLGTAAFAWLPGTGRLGR